MPRGPAYARSPDPFDGVDEAVERHEAEKREWWLEEEAKKNAMEAEKAKAAENTLVGVKRKVPEVEDLTGDQADDEVDDNVDDALADEYTCPITHELPIVPCVAADGHLYDQWALEKWIESQTELKSPMTNKPMGTMLYPAVQARNAIHRLIDKGLIAGPGANKWKGVQKELDAMTPKMREAVSRAHKGDAAGQASYASAFRDGKEGVAQNADRALEWFELAAKQDNAYAIVSLGILWINGDRGVVKNAEKGLVYLTRAAMIGSEHGCITLGNNFAGFRTGILEPDDGQARFWYEKSLDAKVRDSQPISRERRDRWLSR